MPEPLSPKIGLGMKVAVLPLRQATFLTMYLNFMHVVGRVEQLVEAEVDLRLAGGADLVVLALDDQPGSFSSSVEISARRSAKWSTGGTGK